MAVLPMKRICVIGLKRNRKSILEALQINGTVEIADADFSESGFLKTDTSSSQTIFRKTADEFNTAIEILTSYSEEKTSLFDSLKGRKTISRDDYYSYVDEANELTGQAKRIISLHKSIAENKAELIKTDTEIESLSPWSLFDIPLSFSGTKKTRAFIGSFPDKRSYEALLTDFQRLCGDKSYNINIEIVNSLPEQTYVFILCLKKDSEPVSEILRSMGFSKPSVSYKDIPANAIDTLNIKKQSLTEEIRDAEASLKSSAYLLNPFRFMFDYYNMRAEKYDTLSKLNQHKHIFVLNGYIPEKDAASLEARLISDYDAAVEISDITKEDSPGVLLENNRFTEGCEGVVESFSMPGKGESDPTSVMAIFYYILFGIMLSDAAYGAVIALGCGLALKKFKDMELSLRKTLKMFMICGISTVFWGIMFGSYFGDAVTVIAKTFFNADIVIPPLWFTPSVYAMDMLLFSFLLGIIHLFVGLGMKMVSLIKKRRFADALFDVVSWYLLIGGAVAYLLTAEVFINMVGLSFTLPSAVGKIAGAAAVAGAALIIFTAGRSSKKFFIRIAKGLYELYGATSYLSDILSYSRLLALGLATGVIATVFNQMGSMLGGGIGGAIFFTIVFVIGHTLNLAINLLGAYVHTNRLQFVEFFGKFYEGGGKKYEPFSVKTKYYKIKEEN